MVCVKRTFRFINVELNQALLEFLNDLGLDVHSSSRIGVINYLHRLVGEVDCSNFNHFPVFLVLESFMKRVISIVDVFALVLEL